MNIKKNILLLSFTLSISFLFGNKPPYEKNGGTGINTNINTKAANCTPSSGRMFMDFNNVKCIIETAGFLWNDRSSSIGSSYEVPKGGGRFVIYAGALWMGGQTSGGILKVAAHRYRQGNDFWAGPLTTNVEPTNPDGSPLLDGSKLGYGDSQIDPETCNTYDKFWKTSRTEVATHHYCVNLNECPEGGYTTPTSIKNWPGNYIDDGSKYVDYFLAPFVDWNEDQFYNSDDGDYPGYDLFKANACPKPRGGRVDLFGDHNIWYVFNDRGNIHTETGGDDIGMEIKAQAFVFSTADEINSMTFYNYELINRSTTVLKNTYFGQYVDADLGCFSDDFTGCDVQRGFGYIYNGVQVDGSAGKGCEGVPWNDGTPPAIGIDFFEGPYQDNDGKDNIGPHWKKDINGRDSAFYQPTVSECLADDGIPYKGIGLGYSDGTIDNERFGMSRFVYYTIPGKVGAMEDPSTAIEYYNFMRGIWKDGSQFVYGGSGHIIDGGTIPAKYIFPGDSDPLDWGTEGQDPGAAIKNWTETSGGNIDGDRRFFQSAGPFTLEPGALNNITVGVVYARASGGDPFASVDLVRIYDDKAQKLFDNCFRLIDGPDAPDVEGRELDREILLFLTNPVSSNNYKEKYIERDPSISLNSDKLINDTKTTADGGTGYDVGGDGICEKCYYNDDELYRFQGYQVYQLSSVDVGPDELNDVNRARIIFQCDKKDDISRLINFNFDASLGAAIPTEMVNGENQGINHTFKITQDAFAQGDNRLVNYKKYYYMVVAYAENNFRPYNPTDPLFLDGQQKPYLRGRKSATGSIKVYTFIPHKPIAGQVMNSSYGDTPLIVREEGRGNGGLAVDITAESEEDILINGIAKNLEYKRGRVPVDFKIIDPLRVPSGDFELRFYPDLTAAGDNRLINSKWALIYKETLDTVWSDTTINFKNEQILIKSRASKYQGGGTEFVDIDWGFSLAISQTVIESGNNIVLDDIPDILESTITYSDTTKPWFTGVSDSDASLSYNWIRAGSVVRSDAAATDCEDPADYGDNEGTYEKVLNGTFGPMPLLAYGECDGLALGSEQGTAQSQARLPDLPSIDIVITEDKTKWTRAAVIEMQGDPVLAQGVAKGMIKSKNKSVDKQGLSSGMAGYNSSEGDFGGTQPTGMGWFPGYAINVNTGERMNIAFGEDSWAGANGGNDMLWNPTSDYANYGGSHFIFIFQNESYLGTGRTPIYDNGKFMYETLNESSASKRRNLWRTCTWVGAPLVRNGFDLLETDLRIKLRVANPYKTFSTDLTNLQDPSNTANSSNDWNPLYTFNTADLAHEDYNLDSAKSALDRINIVPNPYYAYSEYEATRLQSTVKIINLPQTCTIKIYNVGGSLIRTFKKDSEITYVDWDLNNHIRVPIASGMYIIHIDVPEVGEKVIKWMGIMRTPDLENLGGN